MNQVEYSTVEMRKLLQRLFPHRQLVLSQFTFFQQIGVAVPSGESFRRGRRCYLLQDVLPIACVLALKEEGIPLKNIESVPSLVRENLEQIFATGENCRLSGVGEIVDLRFPGEENSSAIDAILAGEADASLFWSFDVGALAIQLRDVADQIESEEIQKAA